MRISCRACVTALQSHKLTDQAVYVIRQAVEEQVLTAPQERVALVRPFWEKLPQDDRVRHLTLSLDEVRVRAELIVERHKKQAGARRPPLLQAQRPLSWHRLCTHVTTHRWRQRPLSEQITARV